MSYRPMVYVQGEWAGNAVRFATSDEAMASARNLMARWFLVEDVRVDMSDDEVNYVWDNGLKEVVHA
jgi:ribosomal protein L31E